MARSLPPDARAAVLAWYDVNGRSLAFRTTRDPYAVLVSEVMAQQTQVGRVVEAWHRFLVRFPTVGTLAEASPADVLRSWQGMGYDRRALNLWRAARVIRDEHAGRVPRSVDALDRLPGVGPYTARAVAAIAFGVRVGAVDTNVRRVLSRALAASTGEAFTAATLQQAADASVDVDRPGDWTHALMDVGATLCLPRTTLCGECPLRAWCRWAAKQHPADRDRVGAARSRRDESIPAATPSLRRSRRERAPALPFTQTTRWLRGRIVDRLRAADGLAWTELAGPIGSHDDVALDAALVALARDGIIELDPATPRRARLATA